MSEEVKAKAPKKKVDPAHPPFKVMVVAAVANLKDRKGSSRQAIQKYVEDNYKVNDNSKKFVNNTLVKAVKGGELVQTKGTGASGSFKLAKQEKPAKKVAKKPAAKKKTPKKKAVVKKVAAKTAKTTPKKKSAAPKKKTPAAKKKTPKKPAAKKPAAKKATKATPKKKTPKKKTAKK